MTASGLFFLCTLGFEEDLYNVPSTPVSSFHHTTVDFYFLLKRVNLLLTTEMCRIIILSQNALDSCLCGNAIPFQKEEAVYRRVCVACLILKFIRSNGLVIFFLFFLLRLKLWGSSAEQSWQMLVDPALVSGTGLCNKLLFYWSYQLWSGPVKKKNYLTSHELIIQRLSRTLTANGKMKFPFCQNNEKRDLIKLFSCLLTRYIEQLLKRVRQVEKRKFSRFCDTQLSTINFAVCRKRLA